MGSIPEYVFVILSQRNAYAERFHKETAGKNRSDNKMAAPEASVPGESGLATRDYVQNPPELGGR